MDQQKLRSLVFDKTGVKVDIDDPIFALVALNEAVLEEAVERHIARIDAASAELTRHARHAGGIAAVPAPAPAPAVLDATNEPPAEAAAPAPYAPAPAMPVRAIATRTPAITAREWRLLAAAAGVAIVSALTVVGGQAAFSRPAPEVAAAAATPVAAALTPEQTLALQNADKLGKAILKLDPATRSKLQAELQK